MHAHLYSITECCWQKNSSETHLNSWTVQQKRLYPETGKNTPATRQPAPARTKCLSACPRGSAAAGCVSRTREQFGQDTYVRTQCGRDGGASTGDSAGVQLLEMFSFRFWIFFSFKLISPAQIILSCCFLIKLSTYIIHCFYLSSADRVAGGSHWPNIDCVWLLACWLGSCS